MRRKTFFLILFVCYLISPQSIMASGYKDWKRAEPIHFIVIMPSDHADGFGDEAKSYEGVSFPLYCGIASLYPKENKFIFTKTTDLPILSVKEILQPVEEHGYISFIAHTRSDIQIPVESIEFYHAFQDWARINRGLAVYEVSRGQEIPINVVPRFTKTCRYNAAKDPPTDCAYHYWDVEDLYIPFTKEEIKQIEKDHAK